MIAKRTNVQHGLARPRPFGYSLWFPALLLLAFGLSFGISALVLQ